MYTGGLLGPLGPLSKTFQTTKDLSWHLAKLQHEAFSVSLSIAKVNGIPVVGLKERKKRVLLLQTTKDKEERKGMLSE